MFRKTHVALCWIKYLFNHLFRHYQQNPEGFPSQHCVFLQVSKKNVTLKLIEWKEQLNPFVHSRLNPFVPNAPFIYPLKTESRKVFWCFLGLEKGCIGNEWVNREYASLDYLWRLPKLNRSHNLYERGFTFGNTAAIFSQLLFYLWLVFFNKGHRKEHFYSNKYL